MGHGSKGLVKIPVDDHYRIRMDLLRQQIEADRKDGLIPVAVIASAGTINTGAIDPLNDIADLCREEGLWFHIDGAIGAIAVLSDLARPLLNGLEKADSVAIDLHKWLHMPFEAAATLVRHPVEHWESFSLVPMYLSPGEKGIATGQPWFSEYGFQLSRRFRALKIWMSLKEHGAAKFGRMISKNIEQAQYLESLVKKNTCIGNAGPGRTRYRLFQV